MGADFHRQLTEFQTVIKFPGFMRRKFNVRPPKKKKVKKGKKGKKGKKEKRKKGKEEEKKKKSRPLNSSSG
jgi:hypothetical protein